MAMHASVIGYHDKDQVGQLAQDGVLAKGLN